MLERVPEPEVMDTAEEAADYDAMDHADVNRAFCTDFLAEMPAPKQVLDVGTGTALIPIELCRQTATARVVALDLAAHMLERAKANVASANLGDRIALHLRDAKESGFSAGSFDAVISNSIVHHIPDPADALGEMWRLVAPGGVLFVRDLVRPKSHEEVAALVERYAPTGDARTNRQRALFEASLRAGLSVFEVTAIAAASGMNDASVRLTSDRHWTLVARRPTA